MCVALFACHTTLLGARLVCVYARMLFLFAHSRAGLWARSVPSLITPITRMTRIGAVARYTRRVPCRHAPSAGTHSRSGPPLHICGWSGLSLGLGVSRCAGLVVWLARCYRSPSLGARVPASSWVLRCVEACATVCCVCEQVSTLLCEALVSHALPTGVLSRMLLFVFVSLVSAIIFALTPREFCFSEIDLSCCSLRPDVWHHLTILCMHHTVDFPRAASHVPG